MVNVIFSSFTIPPTRPILTHPRPLAGQTNCLYPKKKIWIIYSAWATVLQEEAVSYIISLYYYNEFLIHLPIWDTELPIITIIIWSFDTSENN